MKKSFLLLSFPLFWGQQQTSLAQSEGMLYGSIVTYDNEKYEGPIRWGKEEVLWLDVFNASKTENPNYSYLNADQKEQIRRNRYPGNNNLSILGMNISYSNDDFYIRSGSSGIHEFACRFGEIRKMKPRSNGLLQLEMQNGNTVEVSGSGYNDIGSRVHILDKELGEMELSWDRIAWIEFKPNPSAESKIFGKALFASVTTFDGNFTGYIQWDKEERLDTDKLDGELEDGKVSLEFGRIQSIEKKGNRCKVKLKTGRELELGGSNDVDGSNRGIVVTQSNGVSIEIPWREFQKLEFKPAESPLPGFGSFAKQTDLKAEVKTSRKTLNGRLVFDLDEESNFELLHGRIGELEAYVPFREVAAIRPKSRKSAEVTLKNGDRILMREKQDVSESNEGLLIFQTKGKPEFIRWDEVDEIRF